MSRGAGADGQAVLASVLTILISCSGEPPSGATPAPAAPSASIAAGVPLHPLPLKLLQACREEHRRAPVLCPSVFPRRSVQPPSRLASQSLDLGRGLQGIELGYSAPYEKPSLNRPDRFLHFVMIVRSGRARYGSPSEWETLGSKRFGKREGALFFVREPSIHYHHFLFVWDEVGLEYQASLHSWDDESQAIELLGALVAALESPDRI